MSINSINDNFLIGVVEGPPIPIEITNATVRNSAKIVEDLMKEWKKNGFYDIILWECFREIFENTGFIEKEFENINKSKFRKLRKFLRQRSVWMYNGASLFVSRVFLNIVAENIRST